MWWCQILNSARGFGTLGLCRKGLNPKPNYWNIRPNHSHLWAFSVTTGTPKITKTPLTRVGAKKELIFANLCNLTGPWCFTVLSKITHFHSPLQKYSQSSFMKSRFWVHRPNLKQFNETLEMDWSTLNIIKCSAVGFRNISNLRNEVPLKDFSSHLVIIHSTIKFIVKSNNQSISTYFLRGGDCDNIHTYAQMN